MAPNQLSAGTISFGLATLSDGVYDWDLIFLGITDCTLMANRKKVSEDHILDPPVKKKGRRKKIHPWLLVLLGLVALSCATFRTVLPSDNRIIYNR